MDISPLYAWLIAGVVFIAGEALLFPNIGLLFIGFGAITTGAAIELGFITVDNSMMQFSLWAIASLFWAALLWKSWKKCRARKPQGHYSNIIGDTAYVGSGGLSKTSGGEVTWSGTIMNAKLDPNAGVDHLEAASKVTIIDVTGATLIVMPHKP